MPIHLNKSSTELGKVTLAYPYITIALKDEDCNYRGRALELIEDLSLQKEFYNLLEHMAKNDKEGWLRNKASKLMGKK